MLTDQVLNILKFALLGLVYLFFARVLWAVWSEVRVPRAGAQMRQANAPRQATAPAPTPAPAASAPQQPAADNAGDPTRGQFFDSKRLERKPPRGRSGRAARIVVLEPRTRRGTAIAISGEVTIGRAERCTLSIPDDTFASQLHARIYDHDGQPMIEDLGSTNGTFHNGNKLLGTKLLHPGDRIQVGTTVLEAQ